MSQIKPKQRTGFTLVELLVVIAIIGILVALLLPAVQAAREAARRTQCTNNLKQLSLACHNFHDVHKIIPPSRTASGGFPKLNIPANAYNGWAVWLFPYLEQTGIRDMYNPQLHFGHPNNATAIRTPLSVLQCPSVPNPRRVAHTFTHTGFTIANAAVTDYSVIRNVEFGLITSFPNAVDRLGANSNNDDQLWGPFSYNSGARIREMTWGTVTDGTSNTLFYVEGASRGDRYIWARQKRPGAICQPPSSSNCYAGGAWADEANEFGLHGCTPGPGFDTRPGLNPMNCTNNGEPYGFHPGGINVGMCDGSVRFIAETIPIRTMARLVTASGSEPVGEF